MAYASGCIDIPDAVVDAVKPVIDACVQTRSAAAGPLILGNFKNLNRDGCPSQEDIDALLLKAPAEMQCVLKKIGGVNDDLQLQTGTIKAILDKFLISADQAFLDVRFSKYQYFIFTTLTSNPISLCPLKIINLSAYLLL